MKEFKICTFDYVPKIYERLIYALKKLDINLIAKPPTKLKDFIQKKIDPVTNNEISGVYSIPFKTEHNELVYMGRTSRKFKKRLKEYIRDIKCNRPSTAISRLNQRQDLKIHFQNAKFIIPTEDYYTLRIRESLEILSKRNKVCNDSLWINDFKMISYLVSYFENIKLSMN